MQYFKRLGYEIKKIIFKYVNFLLDLTLMQSKIEMLVRKVTMTSRSFIRRLFIHFGIYNPKLDQLEIIDQLDADGTRSFQQKIKSIQEIIFIINEELFSKRNFMKPFHMINHARNHRKNSKYIKNLISNKRFEQFLLELKVRSNMKTNPYEDDKIITDFLGQGSFLR
jgi:hypothetical protein